MKLYEIADIYNRFWEAVENDEIPEEAFADTLEGITTTMENKIDNIVCLIKNLAAEAEAIKSEEQKLAERRNKKEKQIESLKEYLSNTLLDNNLKDFETPRNKITHRKSERTIINDEKEFICWALRNNDEYLIYKQPVINKKTVKEALARGKQLPSVHVEIRENIQIK